jgi:hypothetical protein
MKAFGNHFKVEDDASVHMLTYDSGVASVFQVPTEDATDVSVNYIGVVKDILKLDYGPMSRPIVLMRCQWAKHSDNRGNPTYIRDDAGFLIVNVWHNLPRMSDPFIFAAQAIQVFYTDDPQKPGWKAVLRKEARAKREVVENANAFITTSVETRGLTAPAQIPPLPRDVIKDDFGGKLPFGRPFRPDVRARPRLPRGRGFTRGRVFTVRRCGKNRVRAGTMCNRSILHMNK